MCRGRSAANRSLKGSSSLVHDLLGALTHKLSPMESVAQIAKQYQQFARLEVVGRSPLYQRLALAVADDDDILDFQSNLPPEKQQPNLLFAAARYLVDAVPTIGDLRELVADEHDGFIEVMLTRRTQTNEPARCATMLLALCQLPGPLTLIEVGASAGLTLLIDRYSYDYDGVRITGKDPEAPTISCHLEGRAPRPRSVPEVIWRQGIDLNPLEPTNDDDVRWLECLTWPGEEGRLERLHGAVGSAKRHPVTIRRGDLADELARVVAEAPKDATVVVFHTAVLSYVDPDKRARFRDIIGGLGVTWLSNEAPGTLDWMAASTKDDAYLLVQDGCRILAETDPHGTWVRWRWPHSLGQEDSSVSPV